MGGGAKGVQAAPLGTLGSRRGGRRRLISGGRRSPAICADGDGAPVRERGGIRVGELQEAEEVPFPGLVCSEDGRRWDLHDAGALGAPVEVR